MATETKGEKLKASGNLAIEGNDHLVDNLTELISKAKVFLQHLAFILNLFQIRTLQTAVRAKTTIKLNTQ